jgi:hypothetical protein
MRTARFWAIGWAALFLGLLGFPGLSIADTPSSTSKPRIEVALQNILTLDRPGQDGFATIWDGNKYVQCGRLPDRGLRCEAAGSLMQSSLERVLVPDRLSRLGALGWRLDPSFGNYVQIFPAGVAPSLVADRILQVLAEAYDADVNNLEVESTWVARELCPPRNGPSQNLAGIVNDARSMAATAVHACSYTPKPDLGPSRPASSAAEVIDFYGTQVTGEIQRLRVNTERRVFVVFETGIGYVQCQPQTSPPSIYCEAQSAESWEALAGVLTPERVARLHAVGFADPGRGPNYWKKYAQDQVDDPTIAHELLTVLHDVYGYTGLPKLKVVTEEVHR